MRGPRVLFLLLALLTSAGCMRQASPVYYAIDPATGQTVAVVGQPQPVQVQPPSVLQYQPPAAQVVQVAPQPQMVAPQPTSRARTSGRGLMNSPRFRATTQYAVPPRGGPYVAAPVPQYGYAAVSPYEPAYSLDSGDRLRIVVFGQEGISSSYTVDAGGNVNLPLIGSVPARGNTTQNLAALITSKLKQGYVRDPSVSVEVETYRPFFILGEVTNPGQYPYVPNMTIDTAVAIAGGFAPRASKNKVEVTRNTPGQQFRGNVPMGFPVKPGDTIVVPERWF